MRYLKILKQLFSRFDEHGIRYCHWKSNDHVEEGMCGITDLDILVDRRQYLKIREILAATGFKQGLQTFGTKLPAVEGYLGIDDEKGKLAFIHLHYHLVIGKPRVKEFHLPWEKFILDNRIYNERVGIYMIDPHMELILLVLRAAVKIRWRDMLKERLGRVYFSGNWLVQREYLTTRIEMEKCFAICQQLLGNDSADLFRKIVNSQVNLANLQKFGRLCRAHIASTAAYGPWMTNIIMWAREIYRAMISLNRSYLGMRIPVARKTLSAGGVLIVFIGSDGSGKSTMTKELTKWLAWKLDVTQIYLGAGKGSSSKLRWLMRQGLTSVERRGIRISRPRTQDETPHRNNNGSIFYWFAKVCWAAALATEKKAKLRIAWRARNQGIIVVADRYPQLQVEGFNDGPLLGKWLSSKHCILRWLAVWERQPYIFAHNNPPDLVIRLNVDPATALTRDPALEADYIKRRIHAVNSLTFPSTTRVMDVDANRSAEAVFFDVCSAAWGEI